MRQCVSSYVYVETVQVFLKLRTARGRTKFILYARTEKENSINYKKHEKNMYDIEIVDDIKC